PPEVNAGRYGGEHCGDAHEICGNERDVPREKRDRELGRGVVQSTRNLADEPSDEEAEGDSATSCDQEQATRVEGREGAADHRRDGNAVEHESRAVVDEALAFDDRHEAARHAESA